MRCLTVPNPPDNYNISQNVKLIDFLFLSEFHFMITLNIPTDVREYNMSIAIRLS